MLQKTSRWIFAKRRFIGLFFHDRNTELYSVVEEDCHTKSARRNRVSLFIGIDLGTSAVKLLLMNERRIIYHVVTKEYPLEFPKPGWSQQNPLDWRRAVLEGVSELLQGFDGSQVAGIGVGGQMHGLVVLDENDNVIRPAILWNDGRTEEDVAYLNDTVGMDKLVQWTGNIAFAGFTAPKLLWMRKHEPKNFAKIRKITLPKDYINYILTGVHCSDYSDASGMLLLDVEHKCWSREMLDLCGVSETQMPKLYESYETIGTLLPEVAEVLGLPQTVKVCAGAGDNAAAAVGTGVVGKGGCNISLGTSGTIFVSSGAFSALDNPAIHNFAHADGGWHLMGCMLSAASCNKWLMENIFQTNDYAAEQANISDDNLGRNRVFFLPYLMGERSPINGTNARGTFIGMTMDTTRADLTQAVLEGVAFAIRDSFEVARSLGLEISSSKICGGGARSSLWKKIIANVLNIRLEVPFSEQGPGMGGAMLAMVACGVYPTVQAVCDALVSLTDTVEPEPDLVARYEKRYQAFRKIYPACKEIFPLLKGEYNMKIYSVYDPEFKPYGQVQVGFPVEELLEALSKTPVTDGVVYTACDQNLQKLPFITEISNSLFGGMPVQLGWCNGHNTKLNCLEYHRDSEFNLGTEDFILLLAKQDEIVDGLLDTAKVKAFRVPKGVMVECYATTLHYAPCHVDADKGFRVLVALPMGTNGYKPDIKIRTSEDQLLWASNKWLLAHPDTVEAAAGAYVGLIGKNIDLNADD